MTRQHTKTRRREHGRYDPLRTARTATRDDDEDMAADVPEGETHPSVDHEPIIEPRED